MPRIPKIRPRLGPNVPNPGPFVIGSRLGRVPEVQASLIAIGVGTAARSTNRILRWVETRQFTQALSSNRDMIELQSTFERLRQNPVLSVTSNSLQIIGINFAMLQGTAYLVKYVVLGVATVRLYYEDAYGNMMQYAENFRYENGETLWERELRLQAERGGAIDNALLELSDYYASFNRNYFNTLYESMVTWFRSTWAGLVINEDNEDTFDLGGAPNTIILDGSPLQSYHSINTTNEVFNQDPFRVPEDLRVDDNITSLSIDIFILAVSTLTVIYVSLKFFALS